MAKKKQTVTLARLMAKSIEIRNLKRRVRELEDAVHWALGERGEFPSEPPPLNGKWRRAFYWRTELRARAFPGSARGKHP